MTRNEFLSVRLGRAAYTGTLDRSLAGSRRTAPSLAGIGRIRLRFDFSDRRRQSARLENLGGEQRHHCIGADLGADAFDLDQKLRCLLDEFGRIRRETVSQSDSRIGSTAGFGRRSK